MKRTMTRLNRLWGRTGVGDGRQRKVQDPFAAKARRPNGVGRSGRSVQLSPDIESCDFTTRLRHLARCDNHPPAAACCVSFAKQPSIAHCGLQPWDHPFASVRATLDTCNEQVVLHALHLDRLCTWGLTAWHSATVCGKPAGSHVAPGSPHLSVFVENRAPILACQRYTRLAV